MASLKKLFSDSVVYGLSSIVGRFLNYLLVPLYTYHISAASGGYGVVTNVYAYTALLLVILTFGMETTFFYFANKEGSDSKSVFSTALGAVGSVGGIFVLMVLALLGPISVAMGYEAHPEYIAVMAIVVALDAFQAILFARLRFENKAWKFAALKLAFIVLNIGLNLFVFLVAPRWQHLGFMQWYDEQNNVGYIFYINLICTALVTFGFWRELRGFRFSSFDFRILRPMLKYAWPLLVFGIVGILNQVLDKILFPFLYPGEDMQAQLGIYGACVKIAMIMAMITQAFRYAYEPFVFAGGKGKESKESQAVVMKYFVMFTLLAFMVVVCYMDVFKYIIKSDYWAGLRAVPIVMMEIDGQDLLGSHHECHRLRCTGACQCDSCSEDWLHGLCLGRLGRLWYLRVAQLLHRPAPLPRALSCAGHPRLVRPRPCIVCRQHSGSYRQPLAPTGLQHVAVGDFCRRPPLERARVGEEGCGKVARMNFL